MIAHILDPEAFVQNFIQLVDIIYCLGQNKNTLIKELLKDIEKFYRQDVQEIPTLHFDNHLYSPIAVWKKGKKFQDIKTVPVKLNEGETRFQATSRMIRLFSVLKRSGR